MNTLARWTRGAGIAAALALTSALAGAQTWTATLSGPAEAPPNASPGTGFATFTLLGNALRINGTFSGLVGTTTVTHIHCCTAAAFTGAVGVATTTPTFVGFPVGVTSGTFDLLLNLTEAGSFNPVFVTANGGIAGARAALLVGDLEAAQEAKLVNDAISKEKLKADFLLVPHHGSKTSSSALFLDEVRPQFALAQAGYRNRFGHPVESVLARYRERGIQVVISPVCGAAFWRSAQPEGVLCQRQLNARYWHHRSESAP